MKKVSIIYASTTGNTEEVAITIKNKLKDYEVNVIEVCNANDKDISESDLVLFGSSTWNYGDINDDFVDYYDNMSSKLLTSKDFSVFGCGDSIGFSDVFCQAVDLIEAKVLSCGGTKKAQSLKIDFYNDDVNGKIDNFIEELCQ